jgi:drug/metabolite transporter (DMT)-like permease
MNNPRTLVLLTILFWSFGSLLTRLISINSQLLSLSLLFFFSLLFFIGLGIFQYKRSFITKLKQLRWTFFFFGLFGYFFYYLGLVQSFHFYNSGSETVILNYTYPIFTVLFTEVFIRRSHLKKSLIEYAGILLGFFAVFILATQGNIFSFHITNLPAFLWGLSAGISYGFFSAYSSKVPAGEQSMFLLAAIFSSWLLSLVIAIPELTHLQSLTLQDYIVTALLAIIINGFGFLAWTRANRVARELSLSIAPFASLLFILPVLNLVIISIVLHESSIFQPYFLVCLGILIVSSILCQKAAEIRKVFAKLSKIQK